LWTEVKAEASPLALGPHLRIGKPDLRHQVAAGELGQDPGVDPIGLAGQRGEPLRPLGVCDPHVPADELELIVDEAGTGHRLDRCQDWTLLAAETVDEVSKAIMIGRASADRGWLTIGEQGMPVETLAAEIQSDVQHRWASFR
jgi:hypothetical protein